MRVRVSMPKSLKHGARVASSYPGRYPRLAAGGDVQGTRGTSAL